MSIISKRLLKTINNMVFPIGDDNIQGPYKPWLSYILIVLNVLVFVFQFTLGPEAGENFVMEWGAKPAEVTTGNELPTLLSSMFMHGGVMHLLGNMMYLWIFGDNIEVTIGHIKFLLFYLAGGLIATFAHIATDMTSNIPMVGASGAIAAVMGAYIVMFPKSRIKMIFLLFFSIFYLPAWMFLGFWIVQQMFSGVGTLGDASGSGGVAWWAHIGGFAFGLVMGLIFRTKYTEDVA